ncbi:putative Asp/Glu racemase [Bisporella sp. PMI_857]|nr:putative Asp/Glu racemase [Bisporella sp. PMI_857]
MPPKRLRLGILTPSSNTALEPLTQALVSTINAAISSHHITVHFSRFPVTQISLSAASLAQFDLKTILAAAELLAHAEVDIIGWSGISAGWLGFENDVQLCKEIEKATGVRATTSVLALNKVLRLWDVKKLGLVTPYTDDIQEAIVQNYKGIGIEIGENMERHLKITRNVDVADISEEVLDGLIAEVCNAGVDAVSTFCTNFVAAQRVDTWEEKHGIPIFDTVTTVVLDMLQLNGVELKGLKGWGMIFKKPLATNTYQEGCNKLRAGLREGQIR